MSNVTACGRVVSAESQQDAEVQSLQVVLINVNNAHILLAVGGVIEQLFPDMGN